MTEPAVLEEVRELEVLLHQPSVRASRETLERLLHAGFFEVGRSGRRYGRGELIEHLLAEQSAQPVEAEDFGVLQIAPSCVLLTYTSDKLRRPTLRVSVWVHEADRWQLAYHQGTAEAVQTTDRPSTEELQATVERMSARLAGSPDVAMQGLMSNYATLCARFEQDLGSSPREVAIAKSAALMLIQVAAG